MKAANPPSGTPVCAPSIADRWRGPMTYLQFKHLVPSLADRKRSDKSFDLIDVRLKSVKAELVASLPTIVSAENAAANWLDDRVLEEPPDVAVDIVVYCTGPQPLEKPPDVDVVDLYCIGRDPS